MYRIGRVIERTRDGGEIRKVGMSMYGRIYYVWPVGATVATKLPTLEAARRLLNIITSPKKDK